MPVDSLSGILSTALYFTATMMLLFMFLTPIETTYHDANVRAAEQVAQSIALQIDGMTPGMTAPLRVASNPGMSLQVELSGNTVTATVNGVTANTTVRWTMVEALLTSNRDYRLEIAGGMVKIA